MRVVLSYATEFDFHEGHQIARALGTLGHDVRVVNSEQPEANSCWPLAETYPADATLDDVLARGNADLFLYIEPRGLLPRGLERASCHTACFLCDTMLALEPRVDLSRLFDDVLLFHPHAIDRLPHASGRVHWVPLAIDPSIFVDRGVPRDLDVAFVGSTDGLWAPRQPLLTAIARRYRTNDFFGPRCEFRAISEIYNRARIVIHIPVVDALNPRIFEGMGCGALLLTGNVDNRLDTLFGDREHLVVYKSESDALALIDYYLVNEPDRARIARTGYDELHRAHTYAHRMQQVLATLAGLASGCAPARRLAQRDVDDIYQRRHKQAGQAAALFRDARRQPVLSSDRYRALGRATATWLRRAQRKITP